LHDGTETVHLKPEPFQAELQPGQYVELNGRTTVAEGHSALTNIQVKILGNRSLPEARPIEVSRLASAVGQWIETTGSVRLVETNLGRISLMLQEQSQTCRVKVGGKGGAGDLRWLPGGKVRVRGAVTRAGKGRLDPALILTPGMSEIVILELASTNRVQVPVTSIGGLLGRAPGAWTNNPVH